MVTSLIELICSSQTRRARADAGDLFSRAVGGRIGVDQTKFPSFFSDAFFDQFDRHGVFVDSEYTTCLTGRRADSPGELRKVVSAAQDADGLSPFLVVDRIIELRDQVAQGAAIVTKRYPAVHPSGCLVI